MNGSKTLGFFWLKTAFIFFAAFGGYFGITQSILSINSASAAIPTTIGYQGRLKNSSGTAQTGTFSFKFRIYASSTGGVPLYTETQPSVSVDQSFFVVQLGSVTPFPASLDFNQPLFLTTEVNGDGEMSPRVSINSVPYAYTAGGVNSFSSAPISATGGRMYYDMTNGTLSYFDATAGAWKPLASTSTNSQTINNLTWSNAIGANTTSTNLFATNAAFTNLSIGSINPTSLTWVNATGTNTTTTNLGILGHVDTNILPSLDSVLSLGSSALRWNANFGSVTTTNLVATTVSTTNLLWTNATGTNTTSTNLFATTLAATNANFTNATSINISGTTISATNLSATNATLTNLFVTGLTVSSTNPASFANLTWTNATGTNTTSTNLFVVNGIALNESITNLTVTGTTGLQSLTFTNGTSSNWLGFATASGTTLNALSVFTNLLTTPNAVVSGGSINGTQIGNTTPSTGIFTNVTSTNSTTTNFFATNATIANLTVTGATPSSFANLVWTNGTGTNTTSTNLFAANFQATSGGVSVLTVSTGTVANLFATSATATTLAFTNASGSSLLIMGQNVCLQNGINCPADGAPATTSTLQMITDNGATTTNILYALGGVQTLNLTATGTLTAANASFTNATTGWLGATSVSTTNLYVNGTQITGGVPATTATLQTITNTGATTTNIIYALGGVQTLNLTATGTTLLQNTTLASVTATSVTTTNVFATNAAFTNLLIGSINPTNLTWVNATGTNTTSTNLFVVNGVAINQSAANLTVTGTAGLQNLTFVNGTSSNWFGFNMASGTNISAINGTIANFISNNVTITGGAIDATMIGGVMPAAGTFTNLLFANGTSTDWFGFNMASGTSLLASSVQVNGVDVCLLDGTNCPGAAASTATLQLVTDHGNATTNAIQFAGGTSTADIAVIGSSTVLGNLFVGTTTYGGGLDPQFVMDGNDLLAQGRIGSIEGLFSATGVVVGAGSIYGENALNYSVSGTVFAPSFAVFSNGKTAAEFHVDPGFGSIWSYDNTAGGLRIRDLAGTEVLSALSNGPMHIFNISSLNVGATLAPDQSLVYDLGTPSFSWRNVYASGTLQADVLFANSTNTTSTIQYAVSSTAGEFSDRLTVGGVNVCLEDGTHCPPSFSGSSTVSYLTYNDASDTLYPNTNTTSFLVGSSSYGGGLDPSFSVSNGDAFIQGKVGSIGGLYSATSVVVGNSTFYGDGSIVKGTGNISISSNQGNIFINQPGGGFLAVGSSTTLDPFIPTVTYNLSFVATSTDDTLVASTRVGNHVYGVSGFNGNFTVLDISDPTNVTTVGSTPFYAGSPFFGTVVVSGTLAYVVTMEAEPPNATSTFAIFDISDPTNPIELYTQTDVGAVYPGIAIRGNRAYIAVTSHDLSLFPAVPNGTIDIYDVSSSTAPSLVTSTDLGAPSSTFFPWFIVSQGNTLYASDPLRPIFALDPGVDVIDVTAPDAPLLLTTVTDTNMTAPLHLIPNGTALYVDNVNLVAPGTSTMSVIDITTPASASFHSAVTVTAIAGNESNGFALNGNYLFAASDQTTSAFSAFNVSDPLNPSLLTIDVPLAENAPTLEATSDHVFISEFNSKVESFRYLISATDTVPDLIVGSRGIWSEGEIRQNGLKVCLEDGTNCPVVTIPTLQQITDFGNTTTGTIQFAGGTSTAGFTFASSIRVLGTIDNTLRADQNPLSILASITIPSNGAPDWVWIDGNYAYLTSAPSGTLSVVDITDPFNPFTVATTPVTGAPSAVVTQGKYAYVARAVSGELTVYDISHPQNPTFVGSVSGLGNSNTIAISGRYVYAITNATSDNFLTFDVQDPTNPVLVDTETVNGNGNTIVVKRGFAYLTSNVNNELNIFDLSQPAHPVFAGTEALAFPPLGLAVSGRYAYVNESNGNLVIYDVSNPLDPAFVSTLTTGLGGKIRVSGRYLYVIQGSVLKVVDVAVASSPVVVATLGGFNALFQLEIAGRYLYLPDRGNGKLNIIDIGGMETNGLKAASAEIGNLFVRGNGQVDNLFTVGGGLAVGVGGIMTDGALSVSATNTTSTFAGLITVQGQLVCLQDGTNCPMVSTLQQVTDVGNVTTDAIQFGGGTSTGDFNPDSTDLYSLGSSSTRWSDVWTASLHLGTSTWDLGQADDGRLAVSNSGSEYFTVSSNGNVGIGVTAPAERLDIRGNIQNILHSGQTFTSVATTAIATTTSDIEVVGKYAYIVATSTVQVLDLTTPSHPESVFEMDVDPGVGLQNSSVRGGFWYVLPQNIPVFAIFDISNPSELNFSGSYFGPELEGARDLFASGHFLFVAGSSTLNSYDVSIPSAAVLLSSLDVGASSSPQSVYVQGRNAFVASAGSDELEIADIGNPNAMSVIQTVSLGAGADPTSVFVQGRYAYVTNSGSSTLSVIDIESPTTAHTAAIVSVGTAPSRVVVSGRYAYVTNAGSNDMTVVDVVDPQNSAVIGTIPVGTTPISLSVAGRYAYVVNTDDDSLSVVDIGGTETNGLVAHSAELGTLQVLGNGIFAEQVSINGGLTVGSSGILSYGSISSASSDTTSTFAGGLSVRGQAVCLQDGTGCPSGLSVPSLQEVTDMGSLTTQPIQFGGGTSTGDFVFNAGISVAANATIANDLGIGGQLLNLPTGSREFAAVMTTGTTGTANDIFKSGRYVYIANSSGTLSIYDVSNASNPTLVSDATFGTSLGGVTVRGSYAYVTDTFGNALKIIDVSNPSQPTLAFSTSTGFVPSGVAVSSDYIYVTAGGSLFIYSHASDPSRLAFVGQAIALNGASHVVVVGDIAYLSDVNNSSIDIVDVSDPTNPVLATSTFVGSNPLGLAVSGRYAYVATTFDNQVSIVDISSSTAPVFVTSTAVFFPIDVAVSGRYLYVTSHDPHGVKVFDISDPTNPIFVAQTNGMGMDWLTMDGRYAYAVGSEFSIFSLNGIETNALAAHSAELGSLSVLGSGAVEGDFAITGSLTVQGHSVCFSDGTNCLPSAATFQAVTDGGSVSTNAIQFAGGTSTGDFSVMGTVSTTGLLVSGVRVCLLDGTDCPVGVSGLQPWTDGTTDNMVFLTTSSRSVLLGGNTTATAGFIWEKGDSGTSTLTIGGLTNANVFIGTSTYGGGLDSQFTLDGNDLLVQGQLGSMGGLFSATGVIVGAGSTIYGDGFISKTDGNLTLGASGGSILPSADLAISLGSDSMRFNANFGDVTTTNVTSTGGITVTGGQLLFPDGSFAAPGIAFANNRTSGIANSAGGGMNFFIGGSLHARIPNGGDIQIYPDFGDNFQIMNGGAMVPEFNGVQDIGIAGDAWRNIYASGTAFLENASATRLSVESSVADATTASIINTASNSVAVLQVTGGCSDSDANTDLVLAGNTADTRKFSVRCNGDVRVDGELFDAAGIIGTGGADYAEFFHKSVATLLNPGDVVVLDASSPTSSVIAGSIASRNQTLGVVSTKPGFVGNMAEGRKNDPNFIIVSLHGQVPVQSTAVHNPIQPGDDLMVGNDGVAVKASGPGMVIGTALEGLGSGQGLVMVYVHPHWWAGDLIAANGDGVQLLKNIALTASTTASAAAPLVSSPDFTFSGSAWDAALSTVVNSSFTLRDDVISTTSSVFAIRNGAGESVLAVTNLGNVSISGDLTVGKRLFLGSKTTGQGSEGTYLYVDDTLSPTSTYIATNADGWQTSSTYDYAERYESSEQLVPGDLVTADPAKINSVKRTTSPAESVLGIVSTRPGFVTGAPQKGNFPIALAGRVPTRVATTNGAIVIGDALMSSNVAGVAVKATAAGNIVGIALEAYDGAAEGLISVFVKPSYSAGSIASGGSFTSSAPTTQSPSAPTVQTFHTGLATITAGATNVHVSFATIQAYPLVSVTPNASMEGSWWVSNRSDTGFDIILSKIETHDIEFTWMVSPLQAGTERFMSDNTHQSIDPLTAQPYGPQLSDLMATSTGGTSDVAPVTNTSTPNVPPADASSTGSTASPVLDASFSAADATTTTP